MKYIVKILAVAKLNCYLWNFVFHTSIVFQPISYVLMKITKMID